MQCGVPVDYFSCETNETLSDLCMKTPTCHVWNNLCTMFLDGSLTKVANTDTCTVEPRYLELANFELPFISK